MAGGSGRFRFYRAFAGALIDRRPDCIVVGHRGLASLPSLVKRILGNLFVMRTTAEGFGIAFIEALACGRPVIAGNRAGDRDPLLDERLGKLVDPDDVPSLAEAILAFITGRAPAELTDPDRLSRECVRRFGFAAFEARLRELFADLSGA